MSDLQDESQQPASQPDSGTGYPSPGQQPPAQAQQLQRSGRGHQPPPSSQAGQAAHQSGPYPQQPNRQLQSGKPLQQAGQQPVRSSPQQGRFQQQTSQHYNQPRPNPSPVSPSSGQLPEQFPPPANQAQQSSSGNNRQIAGSQLPLSHLPSGPLPALSQRTEDEPESQEPPVDRINTHSQSSSGVRSFVQKLAAHDSIEFILLSIIGLLLFVCFLFLVALVVLPLVKGLDFNGARLRLLLFNVLIFATLGVGIFAGRLQRQNEIDQLSKDIERLEREKELAERNAVLSSSISNAPRSNIPLTSQVEQHNPNIQFDAEQNQLSTPIASLYDTSRDPDDFTGEEKVYHPHEKVFPMHGAQNMLSHGWQVIAASRRGYGHAYEGKYREDDFNIRIVRSNTLMRSQPDIVLAAIADGVSSKKLSRYGAYAAVQGATNVPNTAIMDMQNLASSLGNGGLEECERKAKRILMRSLSAAYESVTQRASEEHVHVDELHSTLMVFFAVPYDKRSLFIASVQIGDGALFVLEPNKGPRPRDKWHLLLQPQIQTTGNEVQPFMRSDPQMWESYMRCEVVDNTAFIMGMTDGTADDIEPPRPTPENQNPDPFSMVDDFYKRIVEPTFKEQQPEEALLKLLAYRKRQSFDDRTLVCLYHR
jgi:hypothetical protein